ncbi:hypothetical protein D3874_04895 [Oleomonas cavernae]|uniref:Uncharacterized protein n=1 Tax=Oleomonas cavernae TaxID=2320859 RepID=A0A418W8V7_9PROT|nr:hypothetical protein [Oleomonas cavernae]RJF86445.1 hypothetical protein D3874_04895 [Oleomonas cavernae]
MARIDEGAAGAGNRPLDLSGDSPELIAFGLLRYLAQLEQQESRQAGMTKTFDRKWMLDAYAECLEAAKGQRKLSVEPAAVPRMSGRGVKAK